MIDPTLLVAGFGVGLLIGLTSIGSGSLMAPILILALDVRPLLAVGTNLAWSALTKLAGAWQHARQGTVDYTLGLRLAAVSLPASLVGAAIAHVLKANGADDADAFISRAVAAAVLLVAVALLAEPVLGRRLARPDLLGANGRAGLRAGLIGLAVGLLVGLTSVGSGTLVALALLLGSGLAAPRLVGTDVFHAALLASVAALGHLWAGNVDLALMGNLLVGSVPGVLLGSRLAGLLPERAMRPAVAAALVASGVRLL